MRGKAFYNLIKLKWDDDHDLKVEPWQIENLRTLSDEALFARFAKFDIPLTLETLTLYAEKCDSPEELVDCLLLDQKDDALLGKVYLLSFEAWRRFFPNKQTLLIFFDELDHLISLYDQDELEDDETLYDNLFEMCVILDQHVDAGNTIESAVEVLETSCAHDIESFNYEYIASLLDNDQDAAASELLEAFYPYAKDKRWFEFLRVRLLSQADEEEGRIRLDRLFSELAQAPDVDLGFEMLRLLALLDERTAFQVLLDKISSWLHTESDFQQLLNTVRDYFCSLDCEKEESIVASMLAKRENIDPDEKFFPTDRELHTLKGVVNSIQ